MLDTKFELYKILFYVLIFNQLLMLSGMSTLVLTNSLANYQHLG